MKRRRARQGGVIPALAGSFAVGLIVGWWLRSGAPLPAGIDGGGRPVTVRTVPTPPVEPLEPSISRGAERMRRAELEGDEAGRAPDVAATTGEPLIGPGPPSAASVIADLRGRDLRLPIDEADIGQMKEGFAERRNGSRRAHEAVDILAPRNTPIYAVDDGSIAKLFFSKAGGITIYQFDPTRRFCYYYAHLERYAQGLREGQSVSRGDLLGYVGTSGNAPPNTPHLHFAVFELDNDRQWWKGRAIDPYLIFRP